MFRPLLVLGALAISAAPATASEYSATLAQPTNGLLAARDIAWACTASGCTGATDNSRPAVLCQALAKRAGRIDSFFVDGRAFAAAELDRCNASARPAPQPAVASR